MTKKFLGVTWQNILRWVTKKFRVGAKFLVVVGKSFWENAMAKYLEDGVVKSFGYGVKIVLGGWVAKRFGGGCKNFWGWDGKFFGVGGKLFPGCGGKKFWG